MEQSELQLEMLQALLNKDYVMAERILHDMKLGSSSKYKSTSFFRRVAGQGMALTFADVSLIPGLSNIAPGEAKVEGRFSRNVPLKVCIAGSPMDTVTEYKMAIRLALEGGIGIIHRNMTPLEQAREIKRVKRFMHGFIDSPLTVTVSQKLREVAEEMEKRGFDFRSFPVVDADDRLIGIITGNEFDLNDNDPTKTVGEVMTTEIITALVGTTAVEAHQLMMREKVKVIPLVDQDKKLKGMYVLSDVKRLINSKKSNHNLDDDGCLRVGAAVGLGAGGVNAVRELLLHEDRSDAIHERKLRKKRPDVVVIDTAHGHKPIVAETVRAIKSLVAELSREFGIGIKLDVVAGNVTTYEAAKLLIETGADGIRVGQGPGAICTTRVVAGIGVPQLTAINEVARAIRDSGKDIPLIADGGIKLSADISKAIAAGAGCVMLGSLLAGTDESPGEVVETSQGRFKKYRGMGSAGAMRDNIASRQRYGQDTSQSAKFVPEGVEGLVPHKGAAADVIYQLMGGLRAGMSYVGAADIQEMHEKADFVQITVAGNTEAHPSIIITERPTNYPV